MNTKNDDTKLLIFMFLLFPLYSLPLVIKNVIKGEKVAVFLLCLFYALIAFLTVPNFDVVNHGTWAYSCYKSGAYWSFYENKDTFLQLVGYIFLSLGLSYHYVVFTFMFIGGLFFWSMFYDISKHTDLYMRKKLFLLCIFIFPFFGIMSGLRFYLATCILLRAAYSLIVNKDKKGYILLAFVPLVHISLLFHAIIIVFARFIPLHLNKIWFFSIFLTFCILSTILVPYIVPYIGDIFSQDKIDKYTDSESIDYLEGQNLNFYISYYAKKILTIGVMLFLLAKMFHKISKISLFKLFSIFFLLYGVTYSFMILSGRFSNVAFYFFILLFLINLATKQHITTKFEFNFLLATQIFNYFLYCWGAKRIFAQSEHLAYIFYMPMPILLLYPYEFETYDKLYYLWVI